MRICIDIDGVICRLKEPGQTYEELEPVPGAVEALLAMREAGHTIILHTARHMKTCDGNVGLVVARQGATTLDWLARHGVVYDEIFFGKPWAQVYIDDNAHRFEKWEGFSVDKLPKNREIARDEKDLTSGGSKS